MHSTHPCLQSPKASFHPLILLAGFLLVSCSSSPVSIPIGPGPDEIAPFQGEKKEILLPPLVWEKDGVYFIADRMKNRILSFDANGRFLSSAELLHQAEEVKPELFAVDDEGQIYAAVIDSDSGLTDLLKFDADGTFLQNLTRAEGRPQNLTLNTLGHINLVTSREDESFLALRFVDDILMDSIPFSPQKDGTLPHLILSLNNGFSFLIEWSDPAGKDRPYFTKWDTRTGRMLPAAAFPVHPGTFLLGILGQDRPVFLDLRGTGQARLLEFESDGRPVSVKKRRIRTRTIRGFLLHPFLPLGERIAELRFTRSRLYILFP